MRRPRPQGQLFPRTAFGGAADRRQLTKQPDPERLNLNRVTFARSPGGIICVHPCKMARAPDQPRDRVHADAVGSSANIMARDAAEDIQQGPSRGVPHGAVHLVRHRAFLRRGLLQGRRRIGGGLCLPASLREVRSLRRRHFDEDRAFVPLVAPSATPWAHLCDSNPGKCAFR